MKPGLFIKTNKNPLKQQYRFSGFCAFTRWVKTIGALFYDILLVKKTKYYKIGASKITTQKVLPSNPLVAVSDNGAPITSDGGNVLLSIFLNSYVVSRLFNNVEFNDNRKNPRYAKVELLLQMLIQVIEGYRNDDVADYLTQDIEHRLVYAQNMASQPTISRFLSHLTNEDIDELQELNRRIVSLIDERSSNSELVLDLDSTYFETFGHQEKIGFKYHYLNIGYHPLITTDALTGTVRQVSLRSGNTYTGNGVTELVQGYLSTSLSAQHQTIILRGDSGFATPDLMKTIRRQQYFLYNPVEVKSSIEAYGT
ncbi:hypothetical protein EFL45_11620 [Weissella confusa]|nr:hypothetical protein [Weissella confusa]